MTARLDSGAASAETQRMPADRPLTELEVERDRLALLTRKGIGMPVAGLCYWLGVAALVRALPQRSALILSFFLTGAVFPVGALLTRLAGGDLFAKSPTLTPLGLMLAAVQLFYWPIIMVVFHAAPAWTPFTMAVLFGSHFLPYAWLYRSRGYGFLAISVAVVLSATVVIARQPLYRAAPLLAAGCYAVAVALLWQEVRALAPRAD
jgi:hypothetical protein